MPEPLGWMAERERGGFIAGFQSGFAELNPSRFAIRPLHDPEPNLPVNRMNDGKPDAHGHIWRGTTDMAGGRETGALYRYSPDHECGRVDIGYGLPNGPAFSPGGC